MSWPRRIAALSKGGADALHGVQVQAARSPGRTFFRNGLRRSTALTDVATVTRATQAWGFDQAGMLAAFSSGQPVVNTAGLAVYEARTNSVRNPTPQGAVVGVLGSGGSLPTNWAHAGGSTAGLTPSVVATGSEYGMNYVDVRYAGTSSATSFALTFESSTGIAAAAAQVWAGSALARLVGGSASNVTGYYLQIDGIGGSAGTGLGSSSALTSAATKLTATHTLGTGATNVRPTIVFALNNGAAVDFTVRIYYGNIKQGADIGDPPILQTNNAAATRNADVIVEPVNIPVGQSFTVTARFIAPNLNPGSFPTVFELRDAANQNNLTVHFDGQTNNLYAVATSGGSVANYAGGAFGTTRAPGTVIGLAVTVEGGVIKWSVNGGADKTLPALANGPFAAALTLLGVGCRVAGTQQINTALRDLNIEMRAYTPAERAAASDVTLTHDVDFVNQVYRFVGAPYLTPTDLPGTTFSRATEALNADAAGQWYAFASGALRVTSAGCFFGEGTTNKCTNYNAAPTDLTNVTKSGDAAATLTVVDDTAALIAAGFGSLIAAGKMNGKVYKLDNSAGSANAFAIFGGQTGNTNTHTFSVFVRGGAGALAGILSTVAFSSAAAYRRVQQNAVPSSAANQPSVRADPGQIVYFILNQLEEKTYATNPVIVAGAAATRNTDALASANDNNPSAYTIVAEFTVPLTGPAYSQVWHYDDGTDLNRTTVYFDQALARLYALVTTGNVTQALLNMGTVTPGQSYKVAFAVAPNDFAAVMTGGSVQTDASGTVPATSNFRVGHSVYAANVLGSPIKRIRRYAARKTNTELQALVA